MLFSSFCDYDEVYNGPKASLRRSPVYVQLWEWNYDDVALECARYLGPNGIDAVQISPVTEHILGTQRPGKGSRRFEALSLDFSWDFHAIFMGFSMVSSRLELVLVGFSGLRRPF